MRSLAGNVVSRVLVAQLGARMHYAVPRMLHRVDSLSRLFTDICAVKGWPRVLHAIPARCQPAGLRRLLGRVPKDIPSSLITAFNDLGWRYARELARCCDATSSTRVCLKTGSEFCRRIVEYGFGDATAVYGYNTAALELLVAANARGLATFVEQTIAPASMEQRILGEEASRWPEWSAASVDGAVGEKIARESAEWSAADGIVCGSQFVADGIRDAGGPAEKCSVIPYGVEAGRFPYAMRRPRPELLRVLSVGAVGLRKGAPYALAAAARLRGLAEFRFVGPQAAPDAALKTSSENVSFVGQVPRSEIGGHFEWADVFLLPSLCEGSATVTYEAMLSGLPVVCTPNTGSVVESGVDGLVIEAASVDAIVEAIESLARDREWLSSMSERLRTSSAKCTLDSFHDRFLRALQAVTDSNCHAPFSSNRPAASCER